MIESRKRQKPSARQRALDLAWSVDPGDFNAVGDMICAEIYELNAESRFQQQQRQNTTQEP